ncbi:hypothetical protein L1049_009614 [Liquidambar formosana]|uniref:Uncharacterized protein n=1 Tax=Liquidambar formosana TaxID=63359 RepID=A0AAP0R3M2_LIQFO
MARDCCVETYSVEWACQASDVSVSEAADQPPSTSEEEAQDSEKDFSSPAPSTKWRLEGGKFPHVSGPASPSSDPFNSTDSSNKLASTSSVPSADAPLSQWFAGDAGPVSDILCRVEIAILHFVKLNFNSTESSTRLPFSSERASILAVLKLYAVEEGVSG